MANIIPSNSKKSKDWVEGIIYRIEYDDIIKLLNDDPYYQIQIVKVYDKKKNDTVLCYTLMNEDYDVKFNVPTKKYLSEIIRGCTESGLSQKYLSKLRKFN